MRRLLFPSMILVGCCSLCPPKIIEVPVAVPFPNVAMPVEPTYPEITTDSTPKQTMEYCAEKLIAQEGYIKQLQMVLKGITNQPQARNDTTASKNGLRLDFLPSGIPEYGPKKGGE